MTMNNYSADNEKLIELIGDNLNNCEKSKINRLYNTIINNTCLRPITTYKHVEDISNDVLRVEHYGRTHIERTMHYKYMHDNYAKALKVLRKFLPYSKARWICEGDNWRSDTLYHTIYDFKYYLNSNWFTIFNFEK